ncbi:hypothetical protein Runsl_2372 [Runella slithyformis DSM 19594]|uniref:Uncharacterized protein n=1 Tax=Runella slithyformis (strain ATCC 29530 / DSM 19594 / LMG 11500 / NCIMB 11436 / LSU 4) TaxID=761193 RepID=A0A7U3ZK98_RUNSL|nr:hypothetical protein Runsl_2372 [Runella slithyformis DSM 19594]
MNRKHLYIFYKYDTNSTYTKKLAKLSIHLAINYLFSIIKTLY